MKQIKTIFMVMSALAFVAMAGSCAKDNKPNKCLGGEGSGFDVCSGIDILGIEMGHTFPTGGTLDVYEMLTKISAKLDKKVVGYQIAVNVNGLTRATSAYGKAKQSPDCEITMTDCSKFNIASQTKTITVAALLKLLDANGLTVDSSVSAYLPTAWTRTSYMNRLRFRHFISHRTAFPGSNSANPNTSNWDACKTFVESTPQPAFCTNPSNPDGNGFDYKNCNMALMRIIIPTLWRNLATAPAELKNAPQITDELCKKYYELYVKQFILIPANAAGSLKQSSPNDVLYYTFGSKDAGDDYYLDWTGHGGGGGWVMNAVDLAKTMYAIGNNDAICTSANRAIMRNHPTLGWSGGFTNAFNTTRGLAFGHGGDLNSQGGEMHGNFAILPNGVVVAVMINSDDPDGGESNDLFTYIINAYESSIK